MTAYLRTAIVLLTALAATFSDKAALAQADLSPYTRSELGRIRARSRGSDLSVEQITNRTLRSGVQVGVQGVGSGLATGATGGTVGPSSDGVLAPRRAATFNSFGSGSGGSKPFSSVSRGPTVSPYLNLFVGSDGLNDQDVAYNYQTLVKPQIQQMEINQQLQQQQQQLNRQVQQLSTRPAFDPRGSQTMSPTGHPTAFMNYSHFYPSAGGGQQQRQR